MMFHKGWIIGLLLLSTQDRIAAKALFMPSKPYDLTTLQDTTARRVDATKKPSPEKKSETVQKKVEEKVQETVVKTVPKARNQQIPRPVVPKIKPVIPKVKVKTNVNTKIRIKL